VVNPKSSEIDALLVNAPDSSADGSSTAQLCVPMARRGCASPPKA
jgi:hypothetical protein